MQASQHVCIAHARRDNENGDNWPFAIKFCKIFQAEPVQYIEIDFGSQASMQGYDPFYLQNILFFFFHIKNLW